MLLMFSYFRVLLLHSSNGLCSFKILSASYALFFYSFFAVRWGFNIGNFIVKSMALLQTIVYGNKPRQSLGLERFLCGL